MNQPYQTIHVRTIGTLKGLISFHEFGPQGPCPGIGLKVKIRSLFKCVVYNVNVSSLTPYLKNTIIGMCSYLYHILLHGTMS